MLKVLIGVAMWWGLIEALYSSICRIGKKYLGEYFEACAAVIAMLMFTVMFILFNDVVGWYQRFNFVDGTSTEWNLSPLIWGAALFYAIYRAAIDTLVRRRDNIRARESEIRAEVEEEKKGGKL